MSGKSSGRIKRYREYTRSRRARLKRHPGSHWQLVAPCLVLPASAEAAAAWLPSKTACPREHRRHQLRRSRWTPPGTRSPSGSRFDGSFDDHPGRPGVRSAVSWSATRWSSARGRELVHARDRHDALGQRARPLGAASGGSERLESRARSAAGVWRPIQNVATAVSEYQEPRLAIDPSGRATASGTAPAPGHWVVQASTRPANGSWSVPQSLSVLTEDAQRPQVAMDAAGNAIAVWSHTNA